MDINIKFEGNITKDDSFQLNQLVKSIKEKCIVSVKREKPQAGVKDSSALIEPTTDLATANIPIFIAFFYCIAQILAISAPQYSVSRNSLITNLYD